MPIYVATDEHLSDPSGHTTKRTEIRSTRGMTETRLIPSGKGAHL
jgi:hypothetical protein